MTLADIYKKYSVDGDFGCGDKGLTHAYIPEYERILEPYRSGSTVMEIGINQGHSIKMWGEYFIDSKIVGVDVFNGFDKLPFKDKKFDIIISDATKTEFLDQIKDYSFDVIIDDGSHAFSDQKATFLLLKDKMKKGGIYIIEDVLGFEYVKNEFPKLHDNCEIIDLRHVKNRFDDILIIYKF